MQELLNKLASPDGAQVQRAVAELARQPLPPAALALCAHAWHRWGFVPEAATAGRSMQFQAHRLGWYVVDDRTPAEAIQAALAELLRQQLPAEWEALLTAAGLFTAIYPVDVYIGNADAAGYTLDCQKRWQEFEPFREWFRQALPLSEALSREWVTLAQIFWAHFRWQPADWFYGTFSEAGCDYLLRHAVTALVPYPIHYYDLYRQRPYHDYEAEAEENPGELLVLQSNLGLTYFYYAQFCQYHRPEDTALALDYYHRFLAAEPGCLPDNHYHLFSRDATQRAYPPSTQEALTEIGNLLWQQGQPEAARHTFRRAVALRFDNFQAPYERLAALAEQQGDAAGTLAWLAQKARVCAQTVIHEWGRRAQGIGAYFHYDPASQEQLVPNTVPGSYAWSDPSTRVRITYVVDLYQQLADRYFYELLDHVQAAHYYKLHLQALRAYPDTPDRRAQRLATEESRIRLALEQADYWQARSLCEKLLRLDPDNPTALASLGHIRRRLA